MKLVVCFILVLSALDLSTCQILGRILSYDDIFDALERQAERKEHSDHDHKSHRHRHSPDHRSQHISHHGSHHSSHHNPHHDHHHHSHHHDHKHDGRHHQHRNRHLVTSDPLTSASIRNFNEELMASKEQLALVRDLNEKIDRDIGQSLHSRPFGLQTSATTQPVLCKSSHGIASNHLFADHSHNPMDGQLSATNAMPKNFDFGFDPSKYQKDFQSILLSAQNERPAFFEQKPFFSEMAELELSPDQSLHSDPFAPDFAYNRKTSRNYDTARPKKTELLADPYTDFFTRNEMEDFGRPEFEEDTFDKDMMDTKHHMAVRQMPSRRISRKDHVNLFNPRNLRMTKVPRDNWTYLDTVSSKLDKTKFEYDLHHWDFEPKIGDNNKKTKQKEKKSEAKKFGQTKTSTHQLRKNPEKSYDHLNLGGPYPKDQEKSSFNSAGYLDVLPGSKI